MVGDLAHQTCPRLANLAGGFDIRVAARVLLQLIDRDVLAQEIIHVRQAGWLFKRRHHIFGSVNASHAARLPGIRDFGAEKAGAVHVQKRIKQIYAKGIELLRPLGRYVRVAELLAHDMAIFGFGQGVVVAASWT
ncbi:hypothetical protein LGM65_21815 [Burkholderia anthina]|uniref:hypothetical protein n=1 Tax=Burkholderia anthina TaxID=179879 RepID=UPI001CF4BACD|nr:hypothetical protein [Burkholderia anthina]MCA8093490.1 hypothetical protein [Burkholderia anthina]